MAAAVARGGVAGLRRSSLLSCCHFLLHENLSGRTGVLWKQPLARTFFSGRKKLHTAPVGQVFRLRPFHVLVATGGGYAGYRKYEDYKLEQLEKRGIEVPVKLASEATIIAFDEAALKDLLSAVGNRFKLASRAPNAADTSGTQISQSFLIS